MPAHRIVSERQLEVMILFMEDNRGFALGRISNNGPLDKQATTDKWNDLASKLNAVGFGTTKSGRKWRDVSSNNYL